MKNWIINSYFLPKSLTHQFLYGLNKYLYLWITLLFSIIVSYPSFQRIKYYFTTYQYNKNTMILSEKISQQKQLLTNMQQHHQNKNKTSVKFTEINNQLQAIFEYYHTQPETLQWQLDRQNVLYLTLNQKSQTVFNLLYEINQIPNLFAKEITLTKLNQQRLIQLNATLILIQ